MTPEYLEQIHAMYGLLYPAGLNIDCECSGCMSRWNFENRGSKYWSKTEEFIKYAEEREHA